MALFLPLAPLLLLELMLPLPPLPPLPSADTAPLPPEFPLSLTPDSPSRATLRATAMAMAMVTNHHICSGLPRLWNHLNGYKN